MLGFLILLISACLSIVIFSFLFYKLNNNTLRLFKSVQIKITTLSEENKNKLKKTNNILIFILPIFNKSDIIAGLIIGFLFALKDICFSENVIENDYTTTSK